MGASASTTLHVASPLLRNHRVRTAETDDRAKQERGKVRAGGSRAWEARASRC
ncbi:hypothetical protein BDA96_04G097200 [Sorghum bicolor]|uniref:Uncharacterized protein n=1 Tax=Sorghum bicolor TaxID=4558 RepID=A0A921R399_SORBI|nr:hypothetical protein BDA96_04G097200 [Sorghum bicolor]